MTGLAKFRAEGAGDPVSEVPLVVPSNPFRRTLAFDQSLSNTGVVLLIGERILHTDNIKIEAKAEGTVEDYLRRAAELDREIRRMILFHQPDVVAIESPPMGRAALRSAESSVMSAAVIGVAASHLPLMVVQNQRAKKRLTGIGNAKKPEVKRAVELMLQRMGQDKPRPFNEAVADALAVGWYSCEQAVREDG